MNQKVLLAVSGIHVLLLLILLLPTLVIYWSIKELRSNIRFKLFTLYLSTMIAAHLLNAATSYIMYHYHVHHDGTIFKYAGVLYCMSGFCGIALYLWLSVIGYEIWYCFKQSNAEYNLSQDQRRFLWYSLYVWGISSILTVIKAVDLELHMVALTVVGYRTLIMCVNFIMFIVLSAKVYRTRYRVAELTNEPRPKYKISLVILRLFLMMGIPRIFIHPFGNPFLKMLSVLEAMLIFTLFVLKKNVRNSIKDSCCRRKYIAEDDISVVEIGEIGSE